jgi:uncharacterized RmlC-like cupin family protein
MTSYVRHPTTVTKEFLLGVDWDIIELELTTNIELLTAWYQEIVSKFSNLRFDFSQIELLKEEYQKDVTSRHGYEDVLNGSIHSWTLDWPAEKDIPIPPTFAATDRLYPELLTDAEFKIQNKYKFGYFDTMCQVLGEDTFCFSRITQHDTDAVISKHVDAGLGLRLHIPIVTSNASQFLYGEQLDRSYTFTPGRIYIINAKIPHSTVNQGPSRAHIISDPPIDKLLQLISLKGQI